ncbi:hypothetical protein MPER_12227, partial [Moniliophthora perniciosa FA553]
MNTDDGHTVLWGLNPERLGFLHPYDLLRLARTNKDLRQMLMSRSYNDLWKKCMPGIGLRIDDGFESYQRATEPALINMLFCTACTDESTVQPGQPFVDVATSALISKIHDGLWDCLPYTLHEGMKRLRVAHDTNQRDPSLGVKQYRISAAIECTQELWQLSNAEEKEAWMREKRDKTIEDGWRVKAFLVFLPQLGATERLVLLFANALPTAIFSGGCDTPFLPHDNDRPELPSDNHHVHITTYIITTYITT